MAREKTNDLQKIINAAIEGVMKRLSGRIAAAAEELARKKAQVGKAASAGLRGAKPRPRPSADEITTWTTDLRARRVPKFVIEMTGLDTKKKLVAKFGKNITFRRGQPLPPANPEAPAAAAKRLPAIKAGALDDAKRTVTAKPPRVRKVSAA